MKCLDYLESCSLLCHSTHCAATLPVGTTADGVVVMMMLRLFVVGRPCLGGGGGGGFRDAMMGVTSHSDFLSHQLSKDRWC